MLGMQKYSQPSGAKLALLEVPPRGKGHGKNMSQILSFMSSGKSIQSLVRIDNLDHSTKCTDIDPKKRSREGVNSPTSDVKGLTRVRRRSHIEGGREDTLLLPANKQKQKNRRNSGSNAPTNLPVLLLLSPLVAQESGLEDESSPKLSSNKGFCNDLSRDLPSSDNLVLPKIFEQKIPSQNPLSSEADVNKSQASLTVPLSNPAKISSFKGLLSNFFTPQGPNAGAVVVQSDSRVRNLVLKRPQPKKARQDCCWAFCL
jgi:hypothetical protein